MPSLFTDDPHGYPPAITWSRHQSGQTRRHTRLWGHRIKLAHLHHLARRRNALARLTQTAAQLGYQQTPHTKHH